MIDREDLIIGSAWALNDDCRRVLGEMNSELGWSAARIAEWTNLPAHRVSKAHKRLHLLGLAHFGPLFHEDTGLIAGRGYWLSELGLDVQRHILGRAPVAGWA